MIYENRTGEAFSMFPLAGIPTAFKASYGHGRPVIGILAEFDALEGLSQEGGVAERKPKVEGGSGHRCGHNCLGSGALTWHSYGTNNIFSGSTLAVINMTFKFKGVAAHAAVVPHLGRSALDAAELTNIGVQFLREHMPTEDRVHYAFLDAGGKAPNVVQETAELIYKVRSPRLEGVIELAERVKQIARGAAMMTDTSLTIGYRGATSNTIPNQALEEALQKNMEEIGVPSYTKEEEDFARAIADSYEMPDKAVDLAANLSPLWKDILEKHYKEKGVGLNNMVLPYQHWEDTIPASTDVGDVSWICPTAMFFAQCAAAKIPEHSWQYVACNNTSLAHKGLIYAGKILAGTAVDLF